MVQNVPEEVGSLRAVVCQPPPLRLLGLDMVWSFTSLAHFLTLLGKVAEIW